jgi:hypothetical protein
MSVHTQQPTTALETDAFSPGGAGRQVGYIATVECDEVAGYTL